MEGTSCHAALVIPPSCRVSRVAALTLQRRLGSYLKSLGKTLNCYVDPPIVVRGERRRGACCQSIESQSSRASPSASRLKRLVPASLGGGRPAPWLRLCE
jgi:hypothetical protein